MFHAHRKGRPGTGDHSSRRRRTHLRVEPLESRALPTVVAPLFPEVQVNADLAHAPGQSTPAVGVTQDGSYDVAFVRNDTDTSTQIVVRRFRPDGTLPATNPTVVVAAGDAGQLSQPKIAVRQDGAFVVAYLAPTPGGFRSVFTRSFDINGNPLDNPVPVATTGYDTRDQLEPSVAMDAFTGLGSYYVSWTDEVSPTNGDIRYRAFRLDGTPAQPADTAIAATDANEHSSSIAANNRPVISYTRDGANGSSHDVFLYDVSRRGEIQANTAPGVADQSSVGVSGFGFVVTWTDTTGPTNLNVKMRRFTPVGVGQFLSPRTPQEEIVDVNLGNQYRPQVAGSKDGRYIISYVDESGGSPRIAFAEFSAAGNLQTVKRLMTNHASTQTNPAIAANQNFEFVMAADDDATGQTEPWARAFKKLPPAFFAVGGAPGRVQIRRDGDGSLVADFAPYGPSFTDAVAVAWGDVNGDGIPDLVTGAQAGNPDVRVYDGKAFLNGTFDPQKPAASQLVQFFARYVGFNAGVNVAVGDIDGDGYGDVIAGLNSYTPAVMAMSGKRIANHQGAFPLVDFFAYSQSYSIGANVAAGDFNGDGYDDIVTGATQGNPHVKVYNGKALVDAQPPSGLQNFRADDSLLDSFFAYDMNFNVGVYVAVGDTSGTGHPDLITGASTGNPHVKVFAGVGPGRPPGPTPSVVAQFFAYDLQFNIGVRVAAADVENNGVADILTGASFGSPHYRIVRANSTGVKPPAVNGIEGIPDDFQGGVFVGG